MAIRSVFLLAVGFGLIGGLVVAGTRWVVDDGGASSDVREVEPGSPAAAATEFARAWAAGDFEALYLLLSANSQRAYSREEFAAVYSDFALELTANTLSVEVQEADAGHATLAVTVASAYFGDLEYTTTLTLTEGLDGYVVEWSPATVHPSMADRRRFTSTVQRPVRGAIYDRNGAELAVTRDLRYVGLNRSLVTDREGLSDALIAFGFTAGEVEAAFNAPGGQAQRIRVGPVPDGRAALADQTLRVFPGVLIYYESQRVHPLGPAAAHVVGYTREYTAEELAVRRGEGLRPGDRLGATGLEASQDTVLAGSIGAELRLINAAGDVVEVVSSRPFRQGEDISTTLDSAALQAAHARLDGRKGAAVVIDPVTNDLLAVSSSPSFDPDAFERQDAAALAAITTNAASPLADRATSGLYSAGSTFKLVTAAAGLVYGGLTPADTLECGAVWAGVDPPRRNWEGAQGQLTIAEALMRSCNPVFYEIALRLYNETDGALSTMARAFGFGAPTGVEGLVDEAGLVPDAVWKRTRSGEPWYPGDEVNLGIGQGDLLITPLQLANAYSTFVTGELRAPRVLTSAEATARGGPSLTAEQHAHLMLGLQLVTGPRGTASTAFALAGFTDFAGKSGTAEDSAEQQHALFVAMSPAGAPRAVAAVVLDEGSSGSVEAAPIARDIIIAALN